MRRSLFIKIFSGYFLIITLLAGSFFLFSYRTLRRQHIDTLTVELENLGKTLALQMLPFVGSHDSEEMNRVVKQLGKSIRTRITVIDPKGSVLADSEKDFRAMENHKTRPEVIQAIYGSVGSSLRYSTTVKQEMLYVAVPMQAGGRVEGVVRVSRFLDSIDIILSDLRRSIVQLTIIIAVIALLIALYSARRLTKPIRKLSRASKKIAAGDFNVRVLLRNNDEFLDFADSFNSMTEKIRNLFKEVSFQKEELNNIISSMREGLLVVNASDDRITLFNESLKKIAGEADIQGRFYWEVVRASQFGAVVKTIKADRKDCLKEVEIGGRSYLCSASLMQPKQEIVLLLMDMTESKNVERMKRDFVVNVSHELRTPLTAIKGFVETMEEDIQAGDSRRYLEIIKRHTERLINIVKDLLDLSNLERVQNLEWEEVHLGALVSQVRKIYDERLNEKKLVMKYEIEENLPVVKGDPFKLEQVFINLIDNAIRYTEEGAITVRVRAASGHVEIDIEDTGIGMDRKHLSRIFERFYVVDKSRSRSSGGTGLGLSIVKHTIQLHHGTVEVQSTPGVGTKFTIALPLDISQKIVSQETGGSKRR